VFLDVFGILHDPARHPDGGGGLVAGLGLF
jgi:hypothetical protein